jgi:hypothetical protein
MTPKSRPDATVSSKCRGRLDLRARANGRLHRSGSKVRVATILRPSRDRRVTQARPRPCRAGTVLGVLTVAISLTGCAMSGAGNDPAVNASGTNTPRVGAHGSVEVAHLRWRLDKVTVKAAIGEPSSGLRARARGIYVVITLRVTNRNVESVSLSENLVSLVTRTAAYSVDSRAQQALLGEGHPAFLLETLGSRLSLSGETGFDVSPSVLRESPALRFAEPGLGSVYGYIELPRNLG